MKLYLSALSGRCEARAATLQRESFPNDDARKQRKEFWREREEASERGNALLCGCEVVLA